MARLASFQPPVHEVSIKAGETVTRRFEYVGTEPIEAYAVGCKSCTKVKMEGSGFTVAFIAPPKTNYKNHIQQGITVDQYTAGVTVYFKDGQPVQIVSDTGELVDNLDKVPISIQIRANIDLT